MNKVNVESKQLEKNKNKECAGLPRECCMIDLFIKCCVCEYAWCVQTLASPSFFLEMQGVKTAGGGGGGPC